ncbi:hypothetical protein CDL15_Pgr011248 [Punica granatum]|uniref:Pectinesterase inhibitor domain-containing protein n=1 Tax=Punica granatum TaxID=22663 RepID=A0A218WFW9_PUNGR|nr:hypothetical protein CDL15_Pgr011248 [Punica granatum]
METKNITILLLTFTFFSSLLLNPNKACGLVRRGGALRHLCVSELCCKTTYPLLCVSTMSLLMNKRSPFNDPLFVFQTSVKVAAKEARAAVVCVDRMIRAEKKLAMLESRRHCRGFFNEAVEDIQNAVNAIPRREYGTITTALSNAIGEFGSCNEEFTGMNKLSRSNVRADHIIDR